MRQTKPYKYYSNPTNATAPAAPPNNAARVLDIWCGNPFTYAVQIYMNYYYT